MLGSPLRRLCPDQTQYESARKKALEPPPAAPEKPAAAGLTPKQKLLQAVLGGMNRRGPNMNRGPR